MGIAGPSLYNAFGGKRALFGLVLEGYAEQGRRARIRRLESSLRPKAAIRAFLAEIVERSLDDRKRRGCLLVNSALDVAPHDPEIGAEIADRLGEIEAFYRRLIAAAQCEGTGPPDRGPKDTARVLLGGTLGTRRPA